MYQAKWGVIALSLILPAVPAIAADLPAFPSAEGFGALASGGRGGEVVHVSTLADGGAGSFRDAVAKPNRTVVFDVGGVINLKSDVAVSSEITIAGQTAPGDGVCLYGRSTSLSGQKNIVIRYMRFREGIQGSKGKCSINASGTHNFILDHCSIEWGRWDCLGLTTDASDITVQYSIVGEGVDPQRFGSLMDSATHVTLSHDLWINNQSRNPKTKGTIQDVNNVIYNWGVTGLAGGHSGADHMLDAINNYIIKGPSSNDHAIGEFTSTDHVYQAGNMVDLDRDGTLNGRPVEEKDFTDAKGSPTFLTKATLTSPIAVTIDDATQAYQKVMDGAGDSLHRDAVDQRLIDEVRSLGKKGAISKTETDIGGQGELQGGSASPSTAVDGIPDSWKTAHHLDVKDANLYKAIDPSGGGYTYLEEYINGLVK